MSKAKSKAQARNGTQAGAFFGKQSHEDPGRRTDDELPDGLVTNVPNRLRSNVQHLQPVIRIAKYVCSFPVESGDHNARIELVQKRLQLLQTQIKGVELKTVYVYVSIEGIRVAAASNPDLFMFHSVRRISYAACNPEQCQFSFLARPPQTPGSLQFCHVFALPSASQAEELHTLVGNCFKLAFAQQLAVCTVSGTTTGQSACNTVQTSQNALFAMQHSVTGPTPPQNSNCNVQLQSVLTDRQTCKQTHSGETKCKASNLLQGNSQSNNCASASQSSAANAHNIVVPVPLAPLPTHSVAPSIVLPGPPSSTHAHTHTAASQSSGLGSSVTTSQTTNDAAAVASRRAAPTRLPKRIIVTGAMKGRRSVSVSSLSIASSCSSSSSSTATGGASTIYTSTCSCTTCTCACSCCEEEAESSAQTARAMSSRCSSLTDLHSLAKQTSTSAQLHLKANAFGPAKRRPSPTEIFVNDENVSLQPSEQLDEQAAFCVRDAGLTPLLRNERKAPNARVRRHGKRSRCSSRASHHSHHSHRSHVRANAGNRVLAANVPVNQHSMATAQMHSHQVVQVAARGTGNDHRTQGGSASRTDTLTSVTSLATNSSTLTNVTALGAAPNAGAQTSSSNSTISGGALPADSNNQLAQRREREHSTAQLTCLAVTHTNSVLQLPVASACHVASNLIAVPIPTVPGTILQSMPTATMLSTIPSAEYDELWQYAWYKGDLPRESVCDLLNDSEVGTFIVRYSSTHPGAFALSVRVPKNDNPIGVSHYLVLRCDNGCYRLKGLSKQWPSIPALIVHLSVIPEMLPCTLKLPTMRLTERNLLFNEQQVAFRRQQSHASTRNSFVVPVGQPVTSQASQAAPPHAHVHVSHANAQSSGQSHSQTQVQMQTVHSHGTVTHSHANVAPSQQRASNVGGKLPRQTSKQRSRQEAIVEDHDESHETDYHRLAHFSSVMSNLKAQS